MKTKHERTHILGDSYFSHGPSLNGKHADVIVEMVGGLIISVKKAPEETINKYEALTEYC